MIATLAPALRSEEEKIFPKTPHPPVTTHTLSFISE
jgi:hypothetical protein